MADFMKYVKSVAWTELELLTIIGGAVASQQWVGDEKICKAQFATNPAWFQGNRDGAPFYIKHSGLGKAIAAVLIAGMIKKKEGIAGFAKLGLLGVAFQGTLQEVRVLTWDKTKGEARFKQIGTADDTAALDAKLRELAMQHRVNGPEYLEGLTTSKDLFPVSVMNPMLPGLMWI